MVVRITEPAFLGACDWCSQGGEEDDVVWVLLEDILRSFLNEGGHGGWFRCLGLRVCGLSVNERCLSSKVQMGYDAIYTMLREKDNCNGERGLLLRVIPQPFTYL
jgi:hypothetical protein